MRTSIQQVPQEQYNEDRMRRAESWFRRSKVAEVNRKQAVSDEERAALDCFTVAPHLLQVGVGLKSETAVALWPVLSLKF